MLLVAVDIEGCAAEVIAVATQLAVDLDCGIAITTALMVPTGLPADTVLPGTDHTVRDDIRRRATGLLEELASPPRALGVLTHTHVYFGPPQNVVLEAVAKLQPRILVLGTHARTGLARWVYGSVEESITRRCPVPVLVVPVPAHAGRHLPELDALRSEMEG